MPLTKKYFKEIGIPADEYIDPTYMITTCLIMPHMELFALY